MYGLIRQRAPVEGVRSQSRVAVAALLGGQRLGVLGGNAVWRTLAAVRAAENPAGHAPLERVDAIERENHHAVHGRTLSNIGSQAMFLPCRGGAVRRHDDNNVINSGQPVHPERSSASMTRSTNATKRASNSFENTPITCDPPYGIEP